MTAAAEGTTPHMTSAPELDRDDSWNEIHRGEQPLQRADRNFGELLQELRVAQTGVQIMFAFLLTLSFTERFARLDEFQRAVYVGTLLGSALTTALLVAPVAVHRLVFQRGRKPELVRIGQRMAIVGLGCLVVTVAGALLLVLDVTVGRQPAVVMTSLATAVFAALWFALPLRLRSR